MLKLTKENLRIHNIIHDEFTKKEIMKNWIKSLK